jgi:hypothetical protein
VGKNLGKFPSVALCDVSLTHLSHAVRVAHTRQTFKEIHDAGGPSVGTLARLAAFDPATQQSWPVRPATLHALDIGIEGWKPEDAQKLYDLPAEPPGVVVRDIDELADMLTQRLGAFLVERLGLRFVLADDPQAAGPPGGGDPSGLGGG